MNAEAAEHAVGLAWKPGGTETREAPRWQGAKTKEPVFRDFVFRDQAGLGAKIGQ